MDKNRIEGAAEQGERASNRKAHMGFAEAVDCPIILFAHLVDTLELFSPSEQAQEHVII